MSLLSLRSELYKHEYCSLAYLSFLSGRKWQRLRLLQEWHGPDATFATSLPTELKGGRKTMKMTPDTVPHFGLVAGGVLLLFLENSPARGESCSSTISFAGIYS